MTKTKSKTLTPLLLLLAAATTITGIGLWWLWAIAAPGSHFLTHFEAQPPITNIKLSKFRQSKVKLKIADGASTQAIGADLETAGVIRSGLAMRLWLKWEEWQGDRLPLRAGVYEFKLDQSLPQVIRQIKTQLPLEVSFTIPEGWAIAEMAQYFEQQGFFSAQDFLQAVGKSLTNESIDRSRLKAIMKRHPWLPPQISSLEGFLYPDTYRIVPDQATPELVADIMLNRFAEVALPIYQRPIPKPIKPVPPKNIKARCQSPCQPNLSLLEWVTFASIVEKEAVIDQERAIIAGVFWQRLKLNMRLESDPTVEYGLNIKQTKDQPLTLTQVRTSSPYNTYLNQGLPPGAIASPGLKSLKATLNSANTDFLFFVARYDGSHIFSRTLAEHEAAIATVNEALKNSQ